MGHVRSFYDLCVRDSLLPLDVFADVLSVQRAGFQSEQKFCNNDCCNIHHIKRAANLLVRCQ